MTSVVGVLCEDGAVIGADGSTTFIHGERFPTIEQPTEKITVIDGKAILVGTGMVGMDQRFYNIVCKACSQKSYDKMSPIEFTKLLCHRGLKDMAETFLKPGKYGAMVAFPHKNEPQLCEFQIPDFQPELKTKQVWFCSMGSAQLITDPFLGFLKGVFWKSGPPKVYEGILADRS